MLWSIAPSVAVVAGGVFPGPSICGDICRASGWTLASSAPDEPVASCWAPRNWVDKGVRGGVELVEASGEGLGDVPPDLVASLEACWGVDSFDGI